MDDDPDSSGGELLPDDRAPAPATDDPNLREPGDRTDNSQHDDAGGDPDRQHGADAAARDDAGRKRPARSLQKRIDELVRQRAAAARDRDLWRDRALSGSADGGASGREGLTPDASEQEPQPGPDDLDRIAIDRAYDQLRESAPHLKDRADSPDWRIAEGDATQPGSALAMDETALSPELAVFADRIADARDRYPDFDRVAFDPAVPVSAAMAETIARSDHGPEIAYQLGRSPELARRIAGLDPLSAARELGRIEAALSPAAQRKVTGAPPPIRTLDGAESPRRDPDAMTYDQYKRWRSAK